MSGYISESCLAWKITEFLPIGLVDPRRDVRETRGEIRAKVGPMGASSAKTGLQWGRRGLDLSSRLEQRTYAPYVMRISMRSEHAAEWSAYRVSRFHAVPFVALDLPSTFGDREESGNTQAFLDVLKFIIFITICCSFTDSLLILNLSLAVCQFVQLSPQDWDPYIS